MAIEKTTAAVAASLLSVSLTYKLIMLGVVILLGANTYAIKELRHARREKHEISKLARFEALSVGVFSGVIFCLTTIYFVDDWIMAWIGAGVGSTMGLTGITRIGDLLIDFLTGLAGRR